MINRHAMNSFPLLTTPRRRPTFPSVTKWRRTILFGDTHVPFHDQSAIALVVDVVADAHPDVLIHMGDLVDCWQISDFDKDPARKETLQDDCDTAREVLRTLQKAAPNATRYLLEGNHEDRLRRAIWRMPEKQRQLAQLRCFRDNVNWPRLLELSEVGWQFVQGQGQARARLLRKLLVKHGSLVRKWSGATARAEWERYGKSGLSGHTHRLGRFYHRDFNGAHVWVETGCTCLLNPEYVEDPDWQQGLVVVSESPDGKRFVAEDVYFQDGRAVWREKEFVA